MRHYVPVNDLGKDPDPGSDQCTAVLAAIKAKALRASSSAPALTAAAPDDQAFAMAGAEGLAPTKQKNR